MTQTHTPSLRPARRGAFSGRRAGALAFAFVTAFAAFGAHAADAPSPEHKELVAKILKLQQPGIEHVARQLAEQPAAQLLNSAGAALASRVPAERREAVAKELQADAKKYVDEAVPIVRERAIRLAPGTIGTLLEQKFNDDELRQIIAVLENPVWTRYQHLGGEMQAAFVEKLVADARPAIDPKVKALEQSMARRLGLDTPAAKPAKKPASR